MHQLPRDPLASSFLRIPPGKAIQTFTNNELVVMCSVALALTIPQTVSHRTLYLGKALLVQVSTAPLDAENSKKHSANMHVC